MADWIRTYIDAIDTALKANFNTKLAVIDSGLVTIPDRAIYKYIKDSSTERPMIHQYPLPSSISEEGLMSGRDQLFMRHYTGVRVFDDESSAVLNQLYPYVEALWKTLHDTDTNPGKLSGTVCRWKAVDFVTTEEDPERRIAKEGGIIWQATLDVNLTE